MLPKSELPAAGKDLSLLVVDDDAAFANRLAQALQMRGFDVRVATSLQSGMDCIRASPPAFAVFDLRLKDGNGIDLVEVLRNLRRDARVIMLTGYGNIATAVCAAKHRAIDFLAKPADADQITDALMVTGTTQPLPPENAMRPREVRLAHIQDVLAHCNNNLSAAARQLGMHRRTLQRIVRREENGSAERLGTGK